MHTYHKLKAFVVSQSSKITSTPWNMEQLRLIRQKGLAVLAWKHLAYAEAVIHVILGFVMVTTVAYAIPQVIHSPARLTAFWMYIFTYLCLGLLTFLGLYQKSCTTVKVVVTSFIFLQLGVLLLTSTLWGQCKSHKISERSTKSSESDLFSGLSEEDCKYSRFISTTILIPLFIHSIIYSGVLITYIYKFVSTEEEFNFDGKQCLQFANIKIIIEEVP